MMKHGCAILVLGWSLTAQASPLTANIEADIPEAIDALTIAAQNSGYQLVKVQPVDKALVKRGYPDPGVRILFIGKTSALEQAIKTNPRLLSVLPLRLTLIVEEGGVVVNSDDLEMWKEMFPEPETGKLIDSWERDLKVILGDASGY